MIEFILYPLNYMILIGSLLYLWYLLFILKSKAYFDFVKDLYSKICLESQLNRNTKFYILLKF